MPYERPPLSKPTGSELVEKPICTAEKLRDCAITLVPDVAVVDVDAAGRRLILSTGAACEYDNLLLATGAIPRKLTCPGGERALSFRTARDARRIYAAAGQNTNVTVIGAGLIGLELAAVLSGRGVQVTVLEYGPRALGRNVPGPLAARIANRHLAEGVQLNCDVRIERITEREIALADGRCIPADVVVAAIGVLANDDLARRAGLVTSNGVCVDALLQTSDPHIYAAGDCASIVDDNGFGQRFETWQNAVAQGDIAGRNMAGANMAFGGPVWFWSDQYDLGLQAVGDTGGGRIVVRQVDVATELHFFLDAESRLVGAAGLGIANAVAKDIKLAQKLIVARVPLDPAQLSDPHVGLKTILRPLVTT